MKIEIKVTNEELAKYINMDIQVFYRLKKKYPRAIELMRESLMSYKLKGSFCSL